MIMNDKPEKGLAYLKVVSHLIPGEDEDHKSLP
jgi:hypothetical protein